MDSDRRNTLPLKFKLPKTESDSLEWQNNAMQEEQIHRKIWADIEVNDHKCKCWALVVLDQYYDPHLCCFTFRDFQLAPTNKEFERLLGWYLKDHALFTGLEEELTPEIVAKSLHHTVREVAPGLGPRGFSRKFLEEKAQALEKKGKWEPFSAILALIIYGVVMFPNDDDFIDPLTLSVFLAKNLVHALLTNMYYCLYTIHWKKMGVVLCCAPLLYSWILSHIPRKGLWVEFLKNLKWSQKLASLTVDALVWYIPTWNVEKVITSCE